VPVLLVALYLLPPMRDHLHDGPHAHPMRRLVETFRQPNHLRAFALVATMMFGGFSVIPYIAVYLVGNVGLTKQDLPTIYVAGGLLTLFGAPIVGKLADRFGKLPVYRVVAVLSAGMMLVVTHLHPVPVLVAAMATGTLMLTNAGRMVAAMAMVTGSVEPSRRGGFMSANSAVQHFSTGLGAYVGGLILVSDPTNHSIRHFEVVGYIAIAATIASLWLAGRVRPAPGPSKPESGLSMFDAVLDDPLSAAETL
jgi:DHA1 family inner membrane transport protein